MRILRLVALCKRTATPFCRTLHLNPKSASILLLLLQIISQGNKHSCDHFISFIYLSVFSS
jgi:hypothetical protein